MWSVQKVRAHFVIEIQKLPEARKLSKLITANLSPFNVAKKREEESGRKRECRTFPLDYHKNFFDARIATPRVVREKRRRILRIRGNFNNSHS